MISGTRYQLTLEVNRQLKLATDIARGQAEISTTKKILAPSDDPVGAGRVAALARSQADVAIWNTNLKSAAALSSQADSTIGALKTAFDRTAELMLSASNATQSAENRNAIALELQSIAAQVAELRTTQDSRGDPLFPAAADTTAIPVASGINVTAVASREAVFDNVTTPGGASDLISILNAAIAAVQSGNNAAIATSLAATNAAGNHVIAAQGEQGARGARIDALLERNEGLSLDLKEERAGVEGADIQEVVAKIQSQQLSLEAAQAVFARINKSTLFDLLG
jgi:flagellar hook-associated protein 3 FlgL